MSINCPHCRKTRPANQEPCPHCKGKAYKHKTLDADEFWEKQKELEAMDKLGQRLRKPN